MYLDTHNFADGGKELPYQCKIKVLQLINNEGASIPLHSVFGAEDVE